MKKTIEKKSKNYYEKTKSGEVNLIISKKDFGDEIGEYVPKKGGKMEEKRRILKERKGF